MSEAPPESVTESFLAVPMLLALCAAAGYGSSDFLGGRASRKLAVWAVAAISQTIAALVAIPFAAATWSAMPRPSDIGWAAAAGVGAAVGNVLIYHGLSTGRTIVVAPLAAVTSTVLPVVVDVGSGNGFGAVLIAGVICALAAGWFTSGGSMSALGRGRRDAVIGVLAGAGFGTQFAALGQVSADSGLTPAALSQVISAIGLIGAALFFRARLRGIPGRPKAYAAAAGVLAGAATLVFQISVQTGPLTPAVVVASLYPGVTVALAALVDRERPTLAQSVGIALAGAAIVLVRLGAP